MTSDFSWLFGMGVGVDGSQGAFRLGRGSTGFRDVGDPPVPDIDPRSCRAAWYATARAAGGRVGGFTERQYPRNFHSGSITDRDGTHVGLFHAQYPLVAFVDGRRHRYTDEFRDPPTWASALERLGFTALRASLLLSPVAEADTTALSSAEREQMRYWQPETLGATLFNSWD
ncbi:hypothetical protein H181DRAFT_04681 [Streptomyces sp. WMMB 714]|uniref:hypothetical protein n=1 Tax=Streptomyces sp. WMMB 714 TaxID=1286822 RepID=UPI0006978594|nr:hypothetical protein [Streptomyces sp. WMMB 714]SCK51608.1 hypothetical protein H181DRAFT_04681 [Streptomyces sp. WMMB 714]